MYHPWENWENNHLKHSMFYDSNEKHWLRKAMCNLASLAPTWNLVEIQSQALPQVYQIKLNFNKIHKVTCRYARIWIWLLKLSLNNYDNTLAMKHQQVLELENKVKFWWYYRVDLGDFLGKIPLEIICEFKSEVPSICACQT